MWLGPASSQVARVLRPQAATRLLQLYARVQECTHYCRTHLTVSLPKNVCNNVAKMKFTYSAAHSALAGLALQAAR